MSYLGKVKHLHSEPPCPPRRTVNNEDLGWPPDEFDDEEGDMYEAPPCQPGVIIPPRQVEEDMYLDRMSDPIHPPRPSIPPKPQRRNNFFFEPNSDKPPKIDRNEKPGRKKFPPVPVRSSVEEDVYLNPNDEEENNDHVYLEPTAACTWDPRTAHYPNTAPVPAPKNMVKPPIPRAKSNSYLPSTAGIMTASSAEERRTAVPFKLPPISVKHSWDVQLLEAKLGNRYPPLADRKPVVFPSNTNISKASGHENKEWFAGDCNRKTAEELLQRVNKDGAFLIRHSSAQSARQPYTLAVLYQQKVYNVPIRFLEDSQGYALGKEGKKSEEIFISLDEMISYHRHNQLLLIDSKSQAKHTAYLIYPVRL